MSPAFCGRGVIAGKQGKGVNDARQEITQSRGFAVFLLDHLKIKKSFAEGHPIAFKRENRQGQDSSASHGSQSAHSRNGLFPTSFT